jgi:Cu+-exporting ATPase
MTTIELPITGMTCANCANTVERTLKKTEGVNSVAVNFANERAQIEFDTAKVKPVELIERVRKTGYDVVLAQTELPVLGMTCVNCANTIERTLKKLPGVSSANVNYASERASVEYVPGTIGISDMVGAIRKAGYDVIRSQKPVVSSQNDVEQKARVAEIDDRKKRLIVGLAFAIPAFLISMSRDFGLLAWMFGSDFAPMSAAMMEVGHTSPTHTTINILLFALTLPVMIYTGAPFYIHGYKALRNGAANMDVLIALGSLVAFVYSVLVLIGVFRGHVYFETAAVILALISLGKWLEARAKGRTSEAIKRLLNLAPKTARVIRQNQELEIAVDEIEFGDVILVKPGERIATDGVVIEGHSAVDESMLTGESIPRDKKPGDAVIGATVNKEGVLRFEATKIGSETALARIIKLVERAQGSKAPIQALADKISSVFVPVVLVIALLTILGWLLIGRASFEQAMINAVAVLVIACPCALGLATPTAIMVGMGKGAENGILFKSSESLEKAANIDTVVFDKTGTMTQGKPTVTDVLELDSSEFLSLVASVEKNSEHPLAKAIVDYAEAKGVKTHDAKKALAVPGKGITAHVDGHQVTIGNRAMMSLQGVALSTEIERRADEWQSQGKTVMFASRDNQMIGAIALQDTLKEGATETIRALKQSHVKTVMLTGDNARAAKAIATQAGVDNVIADVLPEQKAAKIEDLRIQRSVVAMVGDGINDAPALATADIGMAIGTGTDVAIETADVTLMSGELQKVPQAIRLSKMTSRSIRQNLFWAFFYNVVLIPVAALGLFNQFGPILAAAAMAFSSLFVVSNSLRLRGAKI